MADLDPGRPVVVVGDVGLDVIAAPRTPIAWHTDTPSHVSMVSGGAGGNTAAWLADAGAEVAVLGRVGHDAAGVTLRAELEAAGVRAVLAVDEQLPTCIVVCVVEPDGERSMFPDRGANSAFAPADARLDEAVPDWSSRGVIPHVHLSAYVLFDPGSRNGGLAALARARERGWTTSVDPQAASLITRVGPASFLQWVEGVDLLLPNESEVDALGGLAVLLERGHEVAVTYGAAGARWLGAGIDLRVDAPQIRCVDTTGAGDAFDGGLLARWVLDGDRLAALTAGVATGSRAAAQVGARPCV
ncbi:MAG: carbohydrate kinase family protein [Candidatus Lutibacillus vidarii]